MSEGVREMERERPGQLARQRFMIGKYEIIAHPTPGRSEDG
ncbi:MAG: hypothetical protein ABI654_06105 [Betaproteobacteria bacterium]